MFDKLKFPMGTPLEQLVVKLCGKVEEAAKVIPSVVPEVISESHRSNLEVCNKVQSPSH